MTAARAILASRLTLVGLWQPGAYLQSLATTLNQPLSGRTYDYKLGPNSNSYVRMFMERLALPAALPAGAPHLP